MTREPALDVTFILGPPADPGLRARFDAAQDALGGPGGSRDDDIASIEPRAPLAFVGGNSGEPPLLDDLLSALLDAPIAVSHPVLGIARFRGARVVSAQLRPGDLQGPETAVRNFFEDPDLAGRLAAALGYVLKLDWVFHLRALGPEVTLSDAEIVPGRRAR